MSNALKYKKPVVPIRLQKDVEQPFGLGNRQWIDFTEGFDHGLSKLRIFLREMDSPKGILQSLKDRLADAQWDLRRARPDDQPRIQADIDELNKQIEAQQKIVDDPEAARRQTEQSIQTRLEGERKPEKPEVETQFAKFIINQPPDVAKDYFQDRHVETEQIIRFLNNPAQRILTIVGRGGAGKTAMACRLLKHIENRTLPDDFESKYGKINIGGIVYLSQTGSHKINFAYLFADLCLLLPTSRAQELESVYRNPQTSTDEKTHCLLEAFAGLQKVILLLDNFEDVVDGDGQNIVDSELDDALRAVLHAPLHPLKVIITSRLMPHQFELYEPARQRPLQLDTGLEAEYAKEALRLMDEENLVGFINAGEDLLDQAVRITRGLPRALEALYATLRSDRYTTLEELLNQPVPENVVDVLVGEAFNRLDLNAQKVMQALAIFNRPVHPVAVDYLLKPHVEGGNSAPILQRLVNMHFAGRERGRFYLHPIDRIFALGRIPTEKSNSGWDQQSLTLHAADYFAESRKPREEWKKLDDLAAQLAEFDLRCAIGDYDTAAKILLYIDFDYLLPWKHYDLIIALHEKISGKISDIDFSINNLNDLESTYQLIGDTKSSINCLKKGLLVAQKNNKRGSEGAFLNNLGNRLYR